MAAIVLVAALAAACSSAATVTPPASVTATVPSVAPTTAPSASVSLPSAPASGPATGGPTIMTATVGSNGTLVVAGLNGMTLYTFSKDTANGGTSACIGGCIAKWPALTVPTGSKPSAGSGASGKLATITRPDDGTLQVTYNGLPLYFFTGDHAAGDSNGIYTGWAAVKP